MSTSNSDTTETDTRNTDTKAPMCRVTDCQLPVDIVFVSKDKVRLGMHKKNLEDFGDGFPPPDCESTEDVPLEEDGVVLELLFQLMHKQPQPDLRTVPFDALTGLTEAAHKYIVHHASMACNLALEHHIPNKPFKVLNLAKRYGWSGLEKQAFETVTLKCRPIAIFAYGISVDDAELCSEFLQKSMHADAEVFFAALQYHECHPILANSALATWARLQKRVQAKLLTVLNTPPSLIHKGGFQYCDEWEEFFDIVKAHVDSHTSYAAFQDIVNTEKYRVRNCSYCERVISTWDSRMEAAAATDLQTYKSLKYA
ncbi:hypothetical protein BDP27DRAFT_1315228 [Rhodocollybia butyracea]|uniref:BTB domain-containing protein n=1 Tax=Rhodocollybia butyracea TaxID=206335 RepID=A0A9P5Q7E7_9AGAR|nr:hypothetical protein BDP27DRAFT_1315228 [Rhodocollybia butyracea]